MHERIKQLVLQAKIGTADFDAGSYYVATPDRMQEFAELIVRECAIVANEHVEEIEGVNYGVGRRIKNQFGVE